jgi:PAS domain-containing protein
MATRETTQAGSRAEVHPLERALEQTELLATLQFDSRGRIRSCNSVLARMLGCGPIELRGSALEEVLDSPDTAALLALLRDGRPYVSGRVRLVLRTRERALLALDCALALDGKGGAVVGRPTPGEPSR